MGSFWPYNARASDQSKRNKNTSKQSSNRLRYHRTSPSKHFFLSFSRKTHFKQTPNVSDGFASHVIHSFIRSCVCGAKISFLWKFSRLKQKDEQRKRKSLTTHLFDCFRIHYDSMHYNIFAGRTQSNVQHCKATATSNDKRINILLKRSCFVERMAQQNFSSFLLFRVSTIGQIFTFQLIWNASVCSVHIRLPPHVCHHPSVTNRTDTCRAVRRKCWTKKIVLRATTNFNFVWLIQPSVAFTTSCCACEPRWPKNSRCDRCSHGYCCCQYII